MSSIEDCKLGAPITLQSLASFHLIIPMEASEEISPLYNIHFMKVFPLPSPAGGMLEVADVPD